MTELSLEIEMDVPNYNETIHNRISEYLQGLDSYLAMYGSGVASFDFYNCEVLNND